MVRKDKGKNLSLPKKSEAKTPAVNPEVSMTARGMNDWAGVDKGKYTYREMVEKLDRLRRKWR